MALSPHRTVETIGATIAYVELGDGQPVILHHGGESHKDQYRTFLPLLRPGVRAISYDQRDVGEAEPSGGPYTIGDLADDCIALMDALGISTAHIMGVSLGGAIALHVGLRHPDRVRSLVVGAAPDSFRRPNPTIERLPTLDPDERAALMLAATLSPQAQQDEELVTLLHQLLRGRVTTPGSRRSEAILSHDLSAEALATIHAPTLLVYGELDPLSPPEVGRIIHDRLPHSELVIVPGARHGLSFEFGDLLAELVNDWVARHPVSA